MPALRPAARALPPMGATWARREPALAIRVAAVSATALVTLFSMPGMAFGASEPGAQQVTTKPCGPGSGFYGGCILVTAAGFAPGDEVRARLLSAPNDVALLMADDAGTVTYRVAAQTAAARHAEVVTFSAQGPPTVDAAMPILSADLDTAPASPGLGGNVVVTVPHTAVLRFDGS